ncbi:CbtB domain-containing protein [Streptomyces xantholiticus]|uniref:CbtB domain-containing protein n=1 Tax=Streptomyces xantholiticus TaxID=68285 RepID=UPI0016771626|nr:CbtB-domain containing protein [Streptomyces xantholiticus]GGW67761.1 cobalt transporter [Streptomyces xantholiticus]
MAEAVVSASVSTPSVPVPAALPVRTVLPWAVFVGLLALIALYFVGAEQGATSVFAGTDVHEWVHDGRHLLGFPCH